MSVPVRVTSKAMSDLGNIADHVKKYNDAATARKVVKALLNEAGKLGLDHHHRLGEELDGFEGPPAREVHKWVCLNGEYEIHLEIIEAYAAKPTMIAILRVWDTQQDR
jgi:plasmid stabilization system protein ParE